MRRAWRGAMPVALTLPLGLERRPRVRQRRLRRLAIAALILGAALLAAGYWLPAKAEFEQRLLTPSTTGDTAALPESALGAGSPAATVWASRRSRR